MIYVFLANGFEEIEALATVDVIRRAGLKVETISTNDTLAVQGAHGICVQADGLFDNIKTDEVQMLILPGGMPGAANLDNHERLGALIEDFANAKKPLAAICAAPFVLGKRGILNNCRATCYPGFEHLLEGAVYTASQVERQGNIITAKGPGAALDFAFAIVGFFCGEKKVDELRASMMVVR